MDAYSGGTRIPCKFPDTPINFPVPLRREFVRKLQSIQQLTGVERAETGLIRENSLYFPCITGKFMRDGFARDSLHQELFTLVRPEDIET